MDKIKKLNPYEKVISFFYEILIKIFLPLWDLPLKELELW
jgi:hypothetical protein